MRTLRVLYRDLPDVSAAGRRARWSARTHLPHEADARRRDGDRPDPTPSRSLPYLPSLRDDLPVRRALRPPGRDRPGGGRSKGASESERTRAPLALAQEPAVTSPRGARGHGRPSGAAAAASEVGIEGSRRATGCRVAPRAPLAPDARPLRLRPPPAGAAQPRRH